MPEPTTSRWRAFLQSPHHAVMALGTLGAGFATGEPLYFVAGATAYVLGWVYLPDMRFFQQWLEKRASAQTNACRSSRAGAVQEAARGAARLAFVAVT
jgi:hypothetical protein